MPLKSDPTPLFRRKILFFVRAMKLELPAWLGLPLTKNSRAAIALPFQVGVAFGIAEVISREPLIDACDLSVNRFTVHGSMWLQRVRHVGKSDCQWLLGRDRRCSATSAWALVDSYGPAANLFKVWTSVKAAQLKNVLLPRPVGN